MDAFQTAFQTACTNGDYAAAGALLDTSNPSADRGRVLAWAIQKQDARAVELLLRDGRADPNMCRILYGSHFRDRNIDILHMLLRDARFDPSATRMRLVQAACMYCQPKVLRALLRDARVDPSRDDNQAIVDACGRGGTSVVKQLLRDARVDPTVRNHLPLTMAVIAGRRRVVRLLLLDARVRITDRVLELVGSTPLTRSTLSTIVGKRRRDRHASAPTPPPARVAVERVARETTLALDALATHTRLVCRDVVDTYVDAFVTGGGAHVVE